MTDGKVHLYGGKVLNEGGLVALCDGDCCGCEEDLDCIGVENPGSHDLKATIPSGFGAGECPCDEIIGEFALSSIPNSPCKWWIYTVAEWCWYEGVIPFWVALGITAIICCEEDGRCRIRLSVGLNHGAYTESYTYELTGAAPGLTSWTLPFLTSSAFPVYCPSDHPTSIDLEVIP